MATDLTPKKTTATDSLKLGPHVLASRLIVGTGKYESFDVMRAALELSAADCITVAVRRGTIV